MLPTDSKKSTTLGVQPLPTSSPKKIWHWLRRRQILQEGVWQPNNMGAAALNAVLTSCWMHSPALPSLGMLPPYRIPVHGDEVPQVRPRAFPVQDWNLCWGGGGVKKSQILDSGNWNKLVLSCYIRMTFSSRAASKPGWQEPSILFWALSCVFPVTRAFFFTPWGPLFLAQLLSVLSNEVLNSSQRSYSLLMCSYGAWHNRGLISVGTSTCCCDNNFMSSLSLRSIAT